MGELDLSCCAVGDQNFCPLAERISEAPLQELRLNLMHTQVTGKSTLFLARSLAEKNLRRLEFAPGNDTGEAELVAFADVLKPGITDLDLDLAFCQSTSAANIAIFEKLPDTLEMLKFRKLRDEIDAKSLADKFPPKVRTLELDY